MCWTLIGILWAAHLIAVLLFFAGASKLDEHWENGGLGDE